MSYQQHQQAYNYSTNYTGQNTSSAQRNFYTSASRGGSQSGPVHPSHYGNQGGSSRDTGHRGHGGAMQHQHAAGTQHHTWIERNSTTPDAALNHLVAQLSRDGVVAYFCRWDGCTYPVGFAKHSQVITHIRSLHMQEKPFLCTTCNAAFERKQDAIKHVTSLNGSKQYMCSNCARPFSMKQERDSHEEACLPRDPALPPRRVVGHYRV